MNIRPYFFYNSIEGYTKHEHSMAFDADLEPNTGNSGSIWINGHRREKTGKVTQCISSHRTLIAVV